MHRYLCEFTRITLKEGYEEVFESVQDYFPQFSRNWPSSWSFSLHHAISVPSKLVLITFPESVKQLIQSGYPQSPYSDLSAEVETQLGRLIKSSFGSNFYMIHRYLTAVRPLYTMPCAYDLLTDVFMLGEEEVSDGQRVRNGKCWKKGPWRRDRGTMWKHLSMRFSAWRLRNWTGKSAVFGLWKY